MAFEVPEIRLIRETLEGVLHPSAASTIFFDALAERGGELPSSHQEAMSLVRGPLARQLTSRLGEQAARSLATQLETLLAGLAPKDDPPQPRRRPRRSRSRHDVQTKSLHLTDDVLPVYILAGSKEFCDRMRAALGPNIVSALHIPDLDTLNARLAVVPPAFLLIDGSDFPAIEPTDLADALTKVPGDAVRAIWGADLPYGMSLLDAAQQRGQTLTPFDRNEGIEPLIDVLRSRKA